MTVIRQLLAGRITAVLSLALLLGVIVSCSEREQGSSDALVSREVRSDGVEVITWTEFPDRPLHLDTLHVIDPWSEDTGFQFTSIRRIIGGDRSVYALDTRSREIVQLDLDGRYIKSFGGRGEGPGEFGTLSGMIGHGNALHISDSILRRMTVYSLEGIYLNDYRWPNIPGAYISRFQIGPDGSLFIMLRASPIDPDHQLVLIRCAPDAGVTQAPADTLLQMPVEKTESIELRTETGRAYPVVTTPLFTPYLRWGMLGDKLVTVSTLKYEIAFRDLEGNLVRLLRGPGQGFEMTAAVRNRWLEEDLLESSFGSIFRQVNEAPDRESLNDIPFTEKRQAINGLIVDPLDRIWVQVATEDPAVDGIDIFSAGGDYLGHLVDTRLPVTFLKDGTPISTVYTEDALELYLVMSVPL